MGQSEQQEQERRGAEQMQVDAAAPCAQQRYSVGELAKLAGVSTRALRHYEDCGLLAPARSENGYRVYSAADAKRLAHILAMRSCGLPLPEIRRLLADPASDLRAALAEHLRSLRSQGDSLQDAIDRTQAALANVERMEGMSERDAFETLKEEGLARFEEEFGAEARERYGAEAIDAANERMMALTRDEWDAKELLEELIKVQLRLAMAEGDPAGEAAAELARMHERWIRIHWGDGYSREAHRSLAHGYLADDRFVSYYDGACGEGATEFLVKALEANL